MADGNVRLEERLQIKIGEVKNLPFRGHGRDVYCALSLDQEEIHRTTAIEPTIDACAFFAEEFQFEVPRRFRFLSVYVYNRDPRLKQDRVIGKVAVKREELHRYHAKDFWFPIGPVDADTEVQGKAHIEVFQSGHHEPFQVRLLECVDLAIRNGSCDPLATVVMIYTNDKKETRRTKARRKTVSPRFDETFTFDPALMGAKAKEVQVTLWHDSTGMAENVFLGEVRIPLNGKSSQAWYFLQPRSGKQRQSTMTMPSSLTSTMCVGVGLGTGCGGSPDNGFAPNQSSDTHLGSLRLKIHYTVDQVLRSSVYNPLRQLILQSNSIDPVTASAAFILGEIVPTKLDAAQPLVRVFMHYGKVVPLIRALAKWELSRVQDVNTVFRGNTLVSKMMDEVMRLAGQHYLANTLRRNIEAILEERKPCEIDPTRVRQPADIETNLANLKGYVQQVFKAITDSSVHCPALLCRLFHDLKDLAIERFPGNHEVRYSVISGFIFLRFFAPAILGPKLFELTTEQIDQQSHRTLTLVSKAIQTLGNLGCARTATNGCKEEYMAALFKGFSTEKHKESVRQFLEIISASSNPDHRTPDSPVVLKEGVMIKRAQGRKRFGRKNFKQRYFRLTTQDLTYSKTKGREPLCCIPLNQILAVERLQEDSFKKNNMFQIVQPDRALYIQASNCVEAKEWIDILTKICQTNKNRLQKYHPAAFLNDRWQCCKKTEESAEGCVDVSHADNTDESGLRLNLDPDRELQRIHSLFMQHSERLQNLKSIYTSEFGYAQFEEINSLFTTLTKITDAVHHIEKEHRSYMRLVARATKIGSKQAPIGDDNYLLIAKLGGVARTASTTTPPD